MNDLFETFAPAIRDKDELGQLRSSGFEWSEWVWYKVLAMLIIGIVATLSILIAIIARNWIALGFLYIAAATFAGVAHSRLWRRVIRFERNGRVLTPHGVPRRIGRRELPIKHDAITSIEAFRDGDESCVAIYSDDGRTFIVSRMERFHDARLVAVQLTKALHEMRSSLAVVGASRYRNRHAAAESAALIY